MVEHELNPVQCFRDRVGNCKFDVITIFGLLLPLQTIVG